MLKSNDGMLAKIVGLVLELTAHYPLVYDLLAKLAGKETGEEWASRYARLSRG